MKIVCSIGPQVENPMMMKRLVENGMNIARFNFSHLNYQITKALMQYIKKNLPDLLILQDLQGHKIRVSKLLQGEIKVNPNDALIFCSEDYFIDNKNKIKNLVPISFDGDFKRLLSAKSVLMKDGTMDIDIIKKKQQYLICKSRSRGIIRSEKGLNFPGIDRRTLHLTEKDKSDIIWGLENGIDIICLSYVCYKENIEDLIEFIKPNLENSDKQMPKIWAKIETKEGIDNLKEILPLVDGIMLGRGDLYAEVDIFSISELQDYTISITREYDKDIIIATYILESMTRNPKPTIAEINDIRYYKRCGVSGFMLAGEVGVGKYPIETTETLKRIIVQE